MSLNATLAAPAPVLFKLTTDQIASWNNLQDVTAKAVADNACMGEIIDGLKGASAILNKEGLNNDFLKQLSTVSVIAGDLDEAAQFRSQLKNFTAVYSTRLADQVLAKNISDTKAAAEAKAAAEKAIADKAAADAKAKVEEDAKFAAAGVDAGQAIYGVMSSSTSAAMALGFVAGFASLML
jgi:hypothetical protein